RQRQGLAGTVHHHKINGPQPRGGLAQRAHRQAETIAEAALAINHHNLQRTPQPIVLQSIVTQEDITPDALKLTSRPDAVCIHTDGTAGLLKNTQGLVPAFLHTCSAGQYQRVMSSFATVTAADHTRPPALLLQMFYQRDQQGSLTRTAHRNI